MFQWIATIVIVLAAITWAIVLLVKKFAGQKKPPSDQKDCDGCSSDCQQCPLITNLKK